MNVQLDGKSLTIDQVVGVARQLDRVEITLAAQTRVRGGRRSVERLLKSSRTVYGLNTGFGKLAEVRINESKLDELQLNLIRSHAVGTGRPLTEEEARAMVVVRLNSLLKGNSGIRPEVAQQLARFLNKGVYPEIPCYGSLGASGDLAPSAHLALCMVGEGYALAAESGKKSSSLSVLRRKGIRPIRLKAKEGLAILNGTQFMTGLGCLLVHDSMSLLYDLDVAAALSLEALRGSPTPCEARIQELRPFHGQAHVAARILRLVRDSSLVGSGNRVQDPYSLRCIPQVHGAFYDALKFAANVLETELNSVTDNPIIFPEKDDIVSAGNFHGQLVAIALDLLALVVAEASVISERRVDKLLSGFNQELPLFLTNDRGLNSGFMVTQYTAASLVSECRILAKPASLESASVSAGQEDHASMGATSALKARQVLENVRKVVAIEMMCAAQAIDFLGSTKLGQGTAIAHSEIRKITKRLDRDRPLSSDLDRVAQALTRQEIREAIERTVQL